MKRKKKQTKSQNKTKQPKRRKRMKATKYKRNRHGLRSISILIEILWLSKQFECNQTLISFMIWYFGILFFITYYYCTFCYAETKSKFHI